MIQRIVLVLVFMWFITSCGAAAPAATEPAAATEEPPPATEPPAFQSLEAPTIQPRSAETSTAAPTVTQIPPTPTETPLPTLDLPTEPVDAPPRMVWDGAPTYLGDSQPGFFFRVTYDPKTWAVTTDQFGFPALAHRNLPACVITPAAGRGLPPNTTVEHEILNTDGVRLDVNTVFENGIRKFVTYTGGDGRIITGFEVVFEEQVDECLADAVTVLSTLRSVPVSQATPQS